MNYRDISIKAVLVLTLFFGTIIGKEKEEVKRPKKGSVSMGNGPAVKIDKNFINGLNSATVKVANEVAQSVVGVHTYRYQTFQQGAHPFYQFFYGMPQQPQKPPQQQEKEGKGKKQRFGGGSGIIVSKQGYIFTNAHVIKDADVVEVTLLNKKVFEAEVIGSDELTDIAVLKINPGKEKIRAIKFGDSKNLQIGEWVLAIGNPFGFDHSVTAGIVSQKGRATGGMHREAYQNFIQTDAAVNPGNSGGPLVNLKGELVGINSLIRTTSGGYEGMSFAIPVDMAIHVAEDLIYEGKVIRGFLGVQIDNVDPDLAEAIGLPYPKGAKIVDVLPETPAEKGGVKPSDIVLFVDDEEIEDARHLRNYVAGLRPNSNHTFKILRNGKEKSLTFKITARDGDVAEDDNKLAEAKGTTVHVKRLGFTAKLVNKKLRKQFELEKDVNGIVLTEIENGGSAQNKGLKVGDVLVNYKRKWDKKFTPIEDLEKFEKDLRQLKDGNTIAFNIISDGRVTLMGLRVQD